LDCLGGRLAGTRAGHAGRSALRGGLQAVVNAAMMVQSGAADVVLAGGVRA